MILTTRRGSSFSNKLIMGKIRDLVVCPLPATTNHTLSGRLLDLGFTVREVAVSKLKEDEKSIVFLDLGYLSSHDLPTWALDGSRTVIISHAEDSWENVLWSSRHPGVQVFFELESDKKLLAVIAEVLLIPAQIEPSLCRITMAHPNTELLKTHKDFFESKGFRCMIFSDPKLLWKALTSSVNKTDIKPDLLFISNGMGSCSAISLLEMIRHRPAFQYLPIDVFCNNQKMNEWTKLGLLGAGRIPETATSEELFEHAMGRLQRYIASENHTEKFEDALYQFLFEKCALDQHAIVSITDSKGMIIYVNAKFCEVSQYDPEELLGNNHRLVNSKFHDKEFFSSMWKTITAGDIWEGEIRNMRKDGSFYWVQTTIVPVRKTRLGPQQYISIRTDITVQKVKESSLILSEDRFDRSQDFANIGTWDWNIQTGSLFWSKRIAPLFGYQGEVPETTYANFLSKIHPDDTASVTHAVDQCVAGKSEYRIEHRVIWDDHSVHWLLEKGGVVKDEAGVPVNMLGVVQDITERKNLQGQLEDQSSALSAMNQAIGEYVLFNDFDKSTHTLLDAGAQILKSKFSCLLDLGSTKCSFIFAHENYTIAHASRDLDDLKAYEPCLAHYLERAAENPKNQSLVEVHGQNGGKWHLSQALVNKGAENLALLIFEIGEISSYHQDTQAVLRILQGGCRLLYFALQVNASDQLLREKLIKARNQAERAYKAKSRFISQMSHELRTPLNAVIGFSQLLLLENEAPLSDRQKNYISEIENAGNHLLELINEILELAELNANSIPIHIEKVALKPVIGECIRLVRPLAEKRGIVLVSEEIESNLCVYADTLRLKQVLINLMSNGIKYNRDNGHLEVALKVNPTNVIMSVIDTGIGISQENQRLLFQEFERLGQENTNSEGTGIGLTICKGLIEKMGGKVGAESELGKGSRFWVELPTHQQQKGPIKPMKSESSPGWNPSQPRTVLYVEDNMANIQLMQQVVGMYVQIKLVTATTGAEGKALIDTVPWDLTILDINLPDMSGLNLLDYIRRNNDYDGRPVIALTASYSSADPTPKPGQDFHAVLTKPIDIARLITTLQECL